MHDLDVTTAALWIGGCLMAALGFLVKREIKRNDEYGERIDDLEKTMPGFVRKDDLARTETTIIDAIKDLRSEVRSERDRINRITEHRG